MSHLAASILPLPDSAGATTVLAVADPHLGPSHLTGRPLGGTRCVSVRVDCGDHLMLPQPSGAIREKGRRLEALQRLAMNARRRSRRAEEALAEQRLLTREADHRVANGLQLVHCALSLHAAAASEDFCERGNPCRGAERGRRGRGTPPSICRRGARAGDGDRPQCGGLLQYPPTQTLANGQR